MHSSLVMMGRGQPLSRQPADAHIIHHRGRASGGSVRSADQSSSRREGSVCLSAMHACCRVAGGCGGGAGAPVGARSARSQVN